MPLNNDSFFELYSDWNSKINISAITSKEEFLVKHIEDSLASTKFFDFDNKKIIDIWTWWGFPLLPLAQAFPNSSFVWLDSVNKKLRVINDIASKLGLTNVSLIHARAEELAHKAEFRQQFDIVTERAFSAMSIMIESALPFLKIWWSLIAYQTPKALEELDYSLLKHLGWEVKSIHNYSLSNNMWERIIIIIDKIAKTPALYPRSIARIRNSAS